MRLAHLDWETFSPVDIKSAGADVYASHPDAEVLCMGYAIGNSAPRVWVPGGPEPTDLLNHIAAGGEVAAWNSYFEWTVFEEIVARQCPTWPRPKLAQFHDIMAWAHAAGLPGALEECAKAMGLEERKDADGSKIMKRLTKPRKWNDDGTYTRWTRADAPGDFVKLFDYCRQDVVVERDIAHRLRPLPPAERAIWLVDQRINKRGMRLDVAAVDNARKLVQAEADRLHRDMRRVTGGQVETTTKVLALAELARDYGYAADSMDADAIHRLLQDDNLPEDLRRALEIRREAGKASTAKLSKMALQARRDGRARGQYTYHGTTTGRWAARGIQVQNMPRPKLKAAEVADCVALMGGPHAADTIALGYGAPLDVVSWSLRGMIIPAPGHEFVGGDFANIEGRVLAWLAGEFWKLDAFRDYDAGEGPDLYKVAYGRAFGVEPDSVNSDQRQLGKVQELALGYQGGVGAFRAMAHTYRVNLGEIAEAVEAAASPDAWARAEKKRLWLQVEHGMHADLAPRVYTAVRLLVDAWREAHPRVKAFWREMEECSISAVKNKGSKFSVTGGLITWVCGRDFLFMVLPSGRAVHYARPSVILVTNQFTGQPQEVLRYYAAGKDKNRSKKTFGPVLGYGGLITENAVQAVARDVQRDAMLRCDARGWPITLHTHDEIRCELPRGQVSPEEFAAVMGELPEWAGGLPVAVECEVMNRYHK